MAWPACHGLLQAVWVMLMTRTGQFWVRDVGQPGLAGGQKKLLDLFDGTSLHTIGHTFYNQGTVIGSEPASSDQDYFHLLPSITEPSEVTDQQTLTLDSATVWFPPNFCLHPNLVPVPPWCPPNSFFVTFICPQFLGCTHISYINIFEKNKTFSQLWFQPECDFNLNVVFQTWVSTQI